MNCEVIRVDACKLVAGEGVWEFARRHAAEIDARWDQLRRNNPNYFNGAIYFMESRSVAAGVLSGRFLKSDFKSFLYWREAGAGDTGVADAFGSALIRSAEGYVLLGRQRAGHINGGLAYLPGGFIDERDVAADGGIDIEASIRRELVEETGVPAREFDRIPGYYITTSGTSVSIAAEFHSHVPATDLRREMLDRIAAQDDPELADIVVVKTAAGLDALDLVPYAKRLLEKLLPPA